MTSMRPAFTHLDAANRPTMVDVGDKAVTLREATAEARVRLDLRPASQPRLIKG